MHCTGLFSCWLLVGAGQGSCPFGSSCFYRHAYADGTLWQPSLRKVVPANTRAASLMVDCTSHQALKLSAEVAVCSERAYIAVWWCAFS